MASKLEDYLKNLGEKLSSGEVSAGFMNGATYPDGTSVATVATANEYGNPGNNQPPRPFFRNAIAENKSKWQSSLVKGLSSGRSVGNVLELVGAQIAGDITESIATLTEPELKESTLKARRTRKVRPNNSTKPLVDTTVMITNVTYEVKK